jgi:integrase
MKLSKLRIDALKPPKNGYKDAKGKTVKHKIFWDDELPGFGLRVTNTGVKAYILIYRVKGRQRRITIGRHGEFTPTKARDEAMRLKTEVRAGEDPLDEREKGRKEPTFNDLADEYERVHLPRKKSAREDRRFLAYLRPKLGNRKLSSLSRREIQKLHQKKGESAPVDANRMASLLSKIFNLAIKWDWMTHNLAQGIERFPEPKRDRFVKELELPHLLKAIAQEKNPYIQGFFHLLLLTGSRRSELLTMKWEDLDFDRLEWRIPDTKSGRVHVIPLIRQAIEVLESIPRVSENPYVIVGRKDKQHLKEPAKAWLRIRKKAGLEDVRLHDLRRTVGSYMAMSGESLPLIGKILNHSNASTTQIYARLGDNAPRAALQAVGETVKLAMGNRAISETNLPKKG